MDTIYSHKFIKNSLNNLLASRRVPNAIFLSGPPFVGKFALTLAFLQGVHCKSISAPQIGGCGKCNSCKQIFFFAHPHTLVLSISERVGVIRFYQRLLTKENVRREAKQLLRDSLLGEVRHLLYRREKQFLQPVERAKQSFAQGVKIKIQELEELMSKLYVAAEAFAKGGDQLLEGHFLQAIEKLENSLDRSFIPKTGLKKLFAWCQNNDGNVKTVVVENVELLHPSQVSVFLKALEDPFPNVHFILLCENETRIHSRVIFPLISRCMRFRFKCLSRDILNKIMTDKFGMPKNDYMHTSLEPLFSHSAAFLSKQSGYESLQVANHSLLKLIFSPTFSAAFFEDKFKRALQEQSYKITEMLFFLKNLLEKNLRSFLGEGEKPKLFNDPFPLNYYQSLVLLHVIEENEKRFVSKQQLPINMLLHLWVSIEKLVSKKPSVQ